LRFSCAFTGSQNLGNFKNLIDLQVPLLPGAGVQRISRKLQLAPWIWLITQARPSFVYDGDLEEYGSRLLEDSKGYRDLAGDGTVCET
jgi:hypothetical protein